MMILALILLGIPSLLNRALPQVDHHDQTPVIGFTEWVSAG